MGERNLGIDVLRIFSIALVVLYHYGALGNSFLDGTHGVAIFFMVSGYCMGFSTKNRTGKQFLFARFIRLTPTLVICATLSTVVELSLPKVLPERLHGMKEYLGTIFCLPTGNIVCDLASNLIHGEALNYTYVDGAYWSLLVEIRFYLLLWLLAYVLKNKAPVQTLIPLGLLAGLDGGTRFISSSNDFLPYLSFFSFGIAYRCFQNKERHALFLLISTFTVYCLNSMLRTNGQSIILGTENFTAFALCFLIFVLAMMAFQNKSNRVISSLGVLSYPIYLIHQDIGLIVIRVFSRFATPMIATIIAVGIVLTMSLLVQWAAERATLSIKDFFTPAQMP